MKKGLLAVLSAGVGFASGMAVSKKTGDGLVSEQKKKVKKFKQYYDILLGWLEIKQSGKSLVDYFIKNQYQNIVIYGMGELGVKLYNELKDTEVTIVCAIDKGGAYENIDIEVKEVGELISGVDVIVVTPAFAFDDIEKELEEYMACPIISIEDVIMDY